MTGVQTCALPICFPVTIAEHEALGLVDNNKKVVKVTEKEIDEGFEKLDLSQFDKQE